MNNRLHNIYLISTPHVWPIHPSIYPTNGATAQIGPWPPLLRFRNNNVLRCELVSLTTNPRYLWGTYDFLLGFTSLAKGSSLKALETRPPSHSHLLHDPLCICPWTTTRRLRVWVCWQSLQVEYTGSFLVFNRACQLASSCPTRARTGLS
jgi:hypothetical protein